MKQGLKGRNAEEWSEFREDPRGVSRYWGIELGSISQPGGIVSPAIHCVGHEFASWSNLEDTRECRCPIERIGMMRCSGGRMFHGSESMEWWGAVRELSRGLVFRGYDKAPVRSDSPHFLRRLGCMCTTDTASYCELRPGDWSEERTF